MPGSVPLCFYGESGRDTDILFMYILLKMQF